MDAYFSKISDKNCIKVNDSELEFINKKIEEIKLSKESKKIYKICYKKEKYIWLYSKLFKAN